MDNLTKTPSRARFCTLLASAFAILILGLSAPAAMAEGDKVNLNEASAETLQTLPGVGPSRAELIVELRNSLGGFENFEQLLEVNGIGSRTLEAIKMHGTLDGAGKATGQVIDSPVDNQAPASGEQQSG